MITFLCSTPEIAGAGLAVWKRSHENRRHHYSKFSTGTCCRSYCRVTAAEEVIFIRFNFYFCHFFFKGFDEFMNLVMDDAVEIYMKKDFKRQIGQFKFKLLLGVPYSYLRLSLSLSQGEFYCVEIT